VSKPIPQGDTAQYDAEVTVIFHFSVEAEDDIQAETIATYEWQDNLYHGEIHRVRVDIIQDDDEDDSEEEEY
jgi:hypothetical protein